MNRVKLPGASLSLSLLLISAFAPTWSRADDAGKDPTFFRTDKEICGYFEAKDRHQPQHAYIYPVHQMKSDGNPYRKGDEFQVWVDERVVDHVDIKESERQSQIAQDLTNVVKKWIGISPSTAAPPNCGDAHPAEYIAKLSYDRSTLVLTATKAADPKRVAEKTDRTRAKIEGTADREASDAVRAAGPSGAAEEGAFAADIKAAAKEVAQKQADQATSPDSVDSTKVLTGPNEHMLLSLDLPVTNRKTLKYDAASGALKPSDDKAQLYLGFDYQLGDILNPPRTWIDSGRIVFKGMLLASSKPLDSLGLGVGYTFPKFQFLKGEGLGPLSIFVGRFWTKQDAIVNGTPATNQSYGKSWRVGVSYSLNDMLGKLKI